MWDIGYFYDFTFLMKNQVSHQLVDLLKFYKITDVKVLRRMLKQIVRKIILEFKILIWEPRNELQIAKEKKFDINSKDKKMKLNSKKRDDTNVNVLGFSDETKWNKWNNLAFYDREGH
ncbi:uncharacterized protein OCT59_025688 [Rhizophagus irregularis]|nr:hypothetical protein OCT59_025688 [Rhizophagus irregularis]GET51419.1 hypothetical protein GLOIN_2v1761635 [Rhizophagus irregularis DAOM 181602=DAOM 197198]